MQKLRATGVTGVYRMGGFEMKREARPTEYVRTQLCAEVLARPSDIAVALGYDARDLFDPEGQVTSEDMWSDSDDEYGGFTCG